MTSKKKIIECIEQYTNTRTEEAKPIKSGTREGEYKAGDYLLNLELNKWRALGINDVLKGLVSSRREKSF